MTISERIIEVRKGEGLNQVEFSKKLGLTKQTVSNYETGARQPGLDIILKIADIFNISTDYLLGKSDYKTFEAQKLSSSDSNIFYKDTLNSLNLWNEIDKKTLNILLCSFEFKELIHELIIYATASPETLKKNVKGQESLRKALHPDYTPITDIKELKQKYLKPYVDDAINEVLIFMEDYFD